MAETENKVGITYAEAEQGLYGDKPGLAREAMRKIRALEERHGVETGVRLVFGEGRTKQVRVSVRFYPDVRFYMAEMLPDGSLGESRELEMEEYEKTQGLKL